MHDRLSAKVVEVKLDATGKLWINIDDQCVIRIGHVHNTVVEIDRLLGTVLMSDALGLKIMCPVPKPPGDVVMGGTGAEGDIDYASS